jgi:hypothetical protein
MSALEQLALEIVRYKPSTANEMTRYLNIVDRRVMPVADNVWLELGRGEIALIEDEGDLHRRSDVDEETAQGWLDTLKP